MSTASHPELKSAEVRDAPQKDGKEKPVLKPDSDLEMAGRSHLDMIVDAEQEAIESCQEQVCESLDDAAKRRKEIMAKRTRRRERSRSFRRP